MYELTPNKVFIEILLSCNLYDKWFHNLMIPFEDIYDEGSYGWSSFISNYFSWNKTPEGYQFWYDLARNEPKTKKEIYYV